MTRTPDEIKKGLECCQDYQSCTKYDETQCPYYDDKGCVDTLLADALVLIRQLETARPRWISVEERLPEEKEDVAAIIRYNENVWEYGIAFLMDGSWRANGTRQVTVTHWMPLPEPPKEDAP